MLQPVVPPTLKAVEWKKWLLVCAVLNFALAFMLCFVSIMSGIYEMITVSFLFCATSSFNFCCLAFYMIYITMNWLSYVCTVGLIIQDGGFRNVFTSGYTSVVF
jgi:hypothetical protein